MRDYGGTVRGFGADAFLMSEAAARISALEEAIRAVLHPLRVDGYDPILNGPVSDDCPVRLETTAGDLRRAASLLKESGK